MSRPIPYIDDWLFSSNKVKWIKNNIIKIMTKKITPKIVFIDANIFINCALAETRDLDRFADINTLKDIEKKLDDKEMILILPENIKAEIITGMQDGFKKIEKYIDDSFSKINSYKNENKGKISMLIENEIEKSKNDLINKITKKSKEILNIINKIIEHKNVKVIKLSDKLTLLGIKRSSLMKRPYTSQLSKDKNSYLRDQDCIAFESFLNFLNSNKKRLKKSECIICSADSDYFNNSEKDILHNDIIQEIKCKKLSGYKDILDMLEKEFGNEYSEEQIKEHKSSLDEIQNLNGSFAYDYLGCDVGKASVKDLGVITASPYADRVVASSPYANGVINPVGVGLEYNVGKASIGNLGIDTPFNANGVINHANVDLGCELGKANVENSRIVASSEILKRGKKK